MCIPITTSGIRFAKRYRVDQISGPNTRQHHEVPGLRRVRLGRAVTLAVTLSLLTVVDGGGAPSVAAATDRACPRSQIVITAHRGTGIGTRTVAGGRVSEDTVAAFRAALQLGVDGFETDYWPTSDGQLVSHHDPTLDRMTDSSGRIPGSTWRQIRRVRNSSGAPIPSLRSVQRQTEPYGGIRQQEIRDGDTFTTGAIRRLLAVNKANVSNTRQRVLITSTQIQVLRRVQDIDHNVSVGLIARQTNRPNISELPRWLDVVLIDIRAADKTYIEQAARRGIEVSLRYLNTVREMHRAVSMGATRGVTDRPELLGESC